jgi:NAD(P)H-hydrate epimerase
MLLEGEDGSRRRGFGPGGIGQGGLSSRKATAERHERYGVFLALKEARTVIGEPEGKIFLNPTGNPGMASGGAGDVLTGMVGAFLGRGMDPLQALQAGVYLHGLAGDLARDDKGEEGLIAGDILEAIPAAIRRVQGGGP